MASNRSSREKPTKKADTPDPSITSSTTDESLANELLEQKPGERESSKPIEFNREGQELFLSKLAGGLSPPIICRKFCIDPNDVTRTYHEDREFREKMNRVNDELGENVVAALYQSAMNGSVTAQTFWLKNHPPPGWVKDLAKNPPPELMELMELGDEALIERSRAMELDTSDWGERGAESSSDEIRPHCLSELSED